MIRAFKVYPAKPGRMVRRETKVIKGIRVFKANKAYPGNRVSKAFRVHPVRMVRREQKETPENKGSRAFKEIQGNPEWMAKMVLPVPKGIRAIPAHQARRVTPERRAPRDHRGRMPRRGCGKSMVMVV